MTFNSILYQVDGGVAQIILNKPDRLNALDKQALIEINEAMNSAEENHEVRVIVISGNGRAFSSGFDLKAQMDGRPSGEKIWREILDLDFDSTMRFGIAQNPLLQQFTVLAWPGLLRLPWRVILLSLQKMQSLASLSLNLALEL